MKSHLELAGFQIMNIVHLSQNTFPTEVFLAEVP